MLVSLVSQVLHFHSAQVVEIALVSHNYLNRAGRTAFFNCFVPVGNTFECRGQVNSVYNDYCVGTMKEVLGNLRLGSLANCVPNVQLDLLWLTVLPVAWYFNYLVLVLNSEARHLSFVSIRHELIDDGGLTDVRVANQNNLSFWDVVRIVYVFLNPFVL